MNGAFFNELEKLSAAKSNFNQTRRGRRPMRVDTMLRKDNEGKLLKHKLGEAVGVKMVNGKTRVLSEEEAKQQLAETGEQIAAIQQALPTPKAIMEPLSNLFEGDKTAEEESGFAKKTKKRIERVIDHHFDKDLARHIGFDKDAASHEDEIEGGLADDSKPEDFDAAQLKKGIEVEMEHTDDEVLAKEIAMDHLKEHPNYYAALEQMEKKLEANKTASAKERAVSALESAYKDPSKRDVGKKRFDEPKLSELGKAAGPSKVQWLELPYTEGERGAQNAPIRSKKKPGDLPTVDTASQHGPSRYDDGWSPPSSAIPSKTAAAMSRAIGATFIGEDQNPVPDRETPNPDRIQHQRDKHYFGGVDKTTAGLQEHVNAITEAY
jgi:hypothetical protein